MRRKLIIALAVVIIAIIVIAGAGIILLGKRDMITLQAGYFLKYQSWDSGLGNSTLAYEILAVNSSNIYYKETRIYYESQSGYDFNNTSFYNISNGVSIFPWDPHDSENWKYLGKETIDTKWGEISTDHYTQSNGLDDTDNWIYQGISMRNDGITLSHSHGGSWTLDLVDTNMPQLTKLSSSLETETR